MSESKIHTHIEPQAKKGMQSRFWWKCHLENRQIGRPRFGWEDNIKIEFI
jgi:hypothetical protein